MSSVMSDALKYYDKNNEKYLNIKKKIKYVKYGVVNEKDIEGLKLIFFDENHVELFTSRVEILAKYYNFNNVWIWGWSLPNIKKSLTSIIRKIFLYGTDIDIKNYENILLKNELVTSRFRISDPIQIDMHCALASYLSKKPFIFLWKEFIFRTDIMEVKGEFSEEKTEIIYYTFIVDPPDFSD